MGKFPRARKIHHYTWYMLVECYVQKKRLGARIEKGSRHIRAANMPNSKIAFGCSP